MMYPYMVLADGTEITHSHIIDDDGTEQVGLCPRGDPLF